MVCSGWDSCKKWRGFSADILLNGIKRPDLEILERVFIRYSRDVDHLVQVCPRCMNYHQLMRPTRVNFSVLFRDGDVIIPYRAYNAQRKFLNSSAVSPVKIMGWASDVPSFVASPVGIENMPLKDDVSLDRIVRWTYLNN